MKASKRIMIWIIISLVLQCSVYLFLDKYYYAKEGNIKGTDITAEETNQKVVPNVLVNSFATNITLSDDLEYTASMENGLVNVVDTNTGKARANLKYTSGVQCLTYMWVPGTDIMDIVEKINSNTIKFFSYDADNEVKTEITDTLNKKEISVRAGKSAELKMSVSTGVLYIKVSHTNTSSSMFRIDRNEELFTVNTLTSNIGNFAVASNDDQLAYEEPSFGKIRTNYSAKRTIARPSIIGTDDSDNFYFGNGSTQSNEIYYGKLADNTNSWKSLALGPMVDNTNIVVLQNGSVYTVDRQNSVVKDVKGNKTYNYQGTFLQIDNGNIIYSNGGKLTFKAL